MKYTMAVQIEAEQFLPEEDKIPEGVVSDGLRSPKTDPRSAWILKSPDGTTYLQSGDYVVTMESGDRYAVKPDVFEKMYIPVKEEPKKK